ncbi:MAG: four helix bundle suffix domain-containing protein [bacterium]
MPAPYKKLLTYWYTFIIHDLTYSFCERYIRSFKLKDQMVGAARSAKQNIVEGSESLRTSLKTCIKLTNVARASNEELMADYEDFLRQNEFSIWPKDDKRINYFRDFSYKFVCDICNICNIPRKLHLPQDKEKAANLLLTLCHQASFLLLKQVKSLEEKHEKEGGYTEKLYQRRTKYRGY